MKLVVGLGNPGRSYASDRHNIGFRCVSRFAKKHGIAIRKRRAKAKLGTGEVDGVRVAVAKPQTYVNLSGQAVERLVNELGVAVSDVLVVYDDLDLPLGRLRVRERGGSGGHKGVRSIIECLGDQGFSRIRVGIGRPDGDVVPYVLSQFAADEKEIVTEVVERVVDAIDCIVTQGIELAMNRYN